MEIDMEVVDKKTSKTVFQAIINGTMVILIIMVVILDSNSYCVGTLPNPDSPNSPNLDISIDQHETDRKLKEKYASE